MNRGLRVEFVISKTSSVFCVQCGRIADGKRSNVTVVRILFPVQAPPAQQGGPVLSQTEGQP